MRSPGISAALLCTCKLKCARANTCSCGDQALASAGTGRQRVGSGEQAAVEMKHLQGKLAEASGDDSSATQCTTKSADIARTNMGSCARGSGMLTPLQHSALQRNAEQRRTSKHGICVEDQSADSSATQCTTRSAATEQNSNWQLCQGSGVLTLCNTMHCKALETEMEVSEDADSLCNTVHCKRALQQRRTNMAAVSEDQSADSSAACALQEALQQRRTSDGSCVRGSGC
jgi:hypothetical protein